MVVEKKRAEELLDELGILEPEDIDVEGIAAYCSAFVVYEPLSGAEARIVGNREKAFITVNSRSLRSRQRFSIGHELGHWMWHRGRMALACSSEVQDRKWSGADKEVMANKFAADLLMPKQMFRAQAQHKAATLQTVSELADQFQTSLTATAIRLVEFGSFPCMVVFHSASGREWFFGSREVDGKFWPHRTLDEYSFAYDLMKGKGRSPAGGTVEADTWINHPRASHYEVYENSTVIGPDHVLTLLWWKSEKMIEDLIGDDY